MIILHYLIIVRADIGMKNFFKFIVQNCDFINLSRQNNFCLDSLSELTDESWEVLYGNDLVKLKELTELESAGIHKAL